MSSVDEFDKLYNTYKPLINNLLKRFSVDFYDVDDLRQGAMLGLYEAYKHYDKNKCTKFSTFAYYYILGGIRKSYDELGKYGKLSFNKIRLYIKEHGCENVELILKKFKISYELYYIISNNLDLITLKEGETFSIIEDVPNYREDCLSNLERKILILRKRHYSQQEISKILNVHQTTVSRMIKQIIYKLNNN